MLRPAGPLVTYAFDRHGEREREREREERERKGRAAAEAGREKRREFFFSLSLTRGLRALFLSLLFLPQVCPSSLPVVVFPFCPNLEAAPETKGSRAVVRVCGSVLFPSLLFSSSSSPETRREREKRGQSESTAAASV